MTNTQSFAARELDILSKTWDRSNPDEEPVILEFTPEILALCERFGKSGQSGGSASFVAGAICKGLKDLLLQDPISPISGIEEEWVVVLHRQNMDLEEIPTYQNTRCSALFKSTECYEGIPWYLDAIVWKGDTEGEAGNDWDTFTGTVEGISSTQLIKGFPFTPKTFYIDVTREELPADYTEEPFYELEYYEQRVYRDQRVQKTPNVIEWKKEKYRYVIKDPKQLERVWKYYKQPTQ